MAQRAATRIRPSASTGVFVCLVAVAAIAASAAAQQLPRFKSGIDVINVDVTVTDQDGRFVPGLRQQDFALYEDGVAQPITNFTNVRVPVSLGILLDTSLSMSGDRLERARDALDRFLSDLNDPSDEFFLYRFSDRPVLVESWTHDRNLLRRDLARVPAEGATSLYDAVAEALPLIKTGSNRKKALVIISDGNDTASQAKLTDVERLIKESEVLVYAVGIGGTDDLHPWWRDRRWGRGGRIGRLEQVLRAQWGGGQRPPRGPIPLPFPPGRRPPWAPPPRVPPPPPGQQPSTVEWPLNDAALRDLTDDSGGRTEIIRDASELDGAVAAIADELTKQYYLAYAAAAPRDGRWHVIRVEVPGRNVHIRARTGYSATP